MIWATHTGAFLQCYRDGIYTLIHDCDEKMTFHVCLGKIAPRSIVVSFRLISQQIYIDEEHL